MTFDDQHIYLFKTLSIDFSLTAKRDICYQ